MVKCVNPVCRKQIDEQFYFCPYCGTDNRAPENRTELADHKHQYPGAGPYFCVWCGDQAGQVHLVRKSLRKPLLLIGLSVVCAYVLLLGAVAFATYSPSKPHLFGFGEWSRTEIQTHSSRYGDQTTTKGANLLLMSALIPAVILGVYVRLSRRVY
jgi:hypothetical protein